MESSQQQQRQNITQSKTVYAGFWARALAWVIDAVAFFIVTLVVGFVVFTAMANTGFLASEVGAALADRLVTYGLVIFWWFYCALFESSSWQATVGKKALFLKVTDAGGNRIGFLQATARHLLKTVSLLPVGIGFFIAGFTKRKQALHDVIAKTYIVRKS